MKKLLILFITTMLIGCGDRSYIPPTVDLSIVDHKVEKVSPYHIDFKNEKGTEPDHFLKVSTKNLEFYIPIGINHYRPEYIDTCRKYILYRSSRNYGRGHWEINGRSVGHPQEARGQPVWIGFARCK